MFVVFLLCPIVSIVVSLINTGLFFHHYLYSKDKKNAKTFCNKKNLFIFDGEINQKMNQLFVQYWRWLESVCCKQLGSALAVCM